MKKFVVYEITSVEMTYVYEVEAESTKEAEKLVWDGGLDPVTEFISGDIDTLNVKAEEIK